MGFKEEEIFQELSLDVKSLHFLSVVKTPSVKLSRRFEQKKNQDFDYN